MVILYFISSVVLLQCPALFFICLVIGFFFHAEFYTNCDIGKVRVHVTIKIHIEIPLDMKCYTVVWSSLAHPLGEPKRCLVGDGALQAAPLYIVNWQNGNSQRVHYRRRCATEGVRYRGHTTVSLKTV